MKKKILLIPLALLLAISLVAIGCPAPAPAPAPEVYPSRAIEIVNGHGPGSGSDMTLRAILPDAQRILGQALNISYMPGGATAVATAYVQKQPADGYTIFEVSSDLPCGIATGRLDTTVDDWIFIQCNTHEVSGIHARTDTAQAAPFADSWEEVVEYSKANPDKKITVAGSGLMGIDHFWVALLAKQSGVNLEFIPFDSGGDRRAASQGGHTDLHSDELIDMKGFRDAGENKPILLGFPERLEQYPDVPTTVEMGYTNTIGRWRGVMVKKGTPQDIVDKLIYAFTESFNGEFYQEYLWEERGHDRPSHRSGAEFEAFVRDEVVRFEGVAKELGWLE